MLMARLERTLSGIDVDFFCCLKSGQTKVAPPLT